MCNKCKLLGRLLDTEKDINRSTIHRSYFAVRPRPQLIRGGTVQGPTQATLLAQIAGLHCTNHQCSVALFVGLFPF